MVATIAAFGGARRSPEARRGLLSPWARATRPPIGTGVRASSRRQRYVGRRRSSHRRGRASRSCARSSPCIVVVRGPSELLRGRRAMLRESLERDRRGVHGDSSSALEEARTETADSGARARRDRRHDRPRRSRSRARSRRPVPSRASDAGLIKLPTRDGRWLLSPSPATIGMIDGRGRPAASRRPARRPARSGRVRIAYTYAARRRQSSESDLIRGGVSIPLRTPTASRHRHARGLLARRGRVRRPTRSCAALEGAAAARRPGDRERPPFPRGPAAGRPRRPHDPAQPPLLPRDPRPRVRPCSPLRPPARARRRSTSTTSRRSTTASATCAGDAVLAGVAERLQSVVRSCRHRMPRRRRRVRGHPPRVEARDAEQLYRPCAVRGSARRPIGLVRPPPPLRRDRPAAAWTTTRPRSLERADEALTRPRRPLARCCSSPQTALG